MPDDRVAVSHPVWNTAKECGTGRERRMRLRGGLLAGVLASVLGWGGVAAPPARAATPDALATARRAIQDLLAHFWVGPAATGHIQYGCPKRGGCMWEGAQVANALYGWWRITGSADAAARIAAHWAWLKAGHPATDFTTCGRPSEENYALDDTAWDISFMLQAAEVTHDPAALADARGALDCARARWWDTEFGGGYHYSDTEPGKGNYQTVLILDELEYHRQSGDAAYLARAKQDEAWVASHLLITPEQSVVAPAGVGLYFNLYRANGCHGGPGPVGCPYHMRVSNIAQDQTMLVANMAMCVIDTRLAKITGDPAYHARAMATAAAIRRTETNAANPYRGALGGIDVLTDDQDANVNAYEAINYALEVVPLLPADGQYADGGVLRATAAAIMANDRRADGLYGGDWQGPPDGVWSHHGNNSGPDRMVVSANAVAMVVAAAGAK